MKSLRDFWNRLRVNAQARTAPAAPPASSAPRVEFSYTVYWTKHARRWDAVRRAQVREALMRALAQPGFEANAYERRYRVPGLDEQSHSGASLIALKKVLAAFDTE